MKRLALLCCSVVLCVAAAPAAFGQMGMDLFKKPSIASAFNPVVGKGAQYEETSKRENGAPRTMEMGVVGKEMADGQDGYWMQFSMQSERGPVIAKALITKGDFTFHRMIMQMAGMPPMEMPFNAKERQDAKLKQEDWHQVGTESVTVPAGTFSCAHWRNDKDNSDIWISDKVTPFGMVKQVSQHDTMVLVKLIDVTDKITGPVQKFDPQTMMQQMQQQRQQRQQNPNP